MRLRAAAWRVTWQKLVHVRGCTAARSPPYPCALLLFRGTTTPRRPPPLTGGSGFPLQALVERAGDL